MNPSKSRETLKTMEDVLLAFKSGDISLEDAEKLLKGEVMREIENVATIDLFRELRTGIPEIIRLAAELKIDFPDEIKIVGLEVANTSDMGGELTEPVAGAINRLVDCVIGYLA